MHDMGLPRGPLLLNQHGKAVLNGKSEALSVGDMVIGPFGPRGGAQVGIVLMMCPCYTDELQCSEDLLVSVRWADLYSSITPFHPVSPPAQQCADLVAARQRTCLLQPEHLRLIWPPACVCRPPLTVA